MVVKTMTSKYHEFSVPVSLWTFWLRMKYKAEGKINVGWWWPFICTCARIWYLSCAFLLEESILKSKNGNVRSWMSLGLVLPVPLVMWISSLEHPLPSGTSPSRTHYYLTQHILHIWLHVLWFMRFWFFWKSHVPQMKYIHQPQKLVIGMNFYNRLHGWEAYICSMGYQRKIIKSTQTIVFCE